MAKFYFRIEATDILVGNDEYTVESDTAADAKLALTEAFELARDVGYVPTPTIVGRLSGVHEVRMIDPCDIATSEWYVIPTDENFETPAEIVPGESVDTRALRDALLAVEARILGRLEAPALVAVGYLTRDATADVLHIVRSALSDVQRLAERAVTHAVAFGTGSSEAGAKMVEAGLAFETALATAESDIGALRADAERYRWLVAHEIVFIRGRFSISRDGSNHLIDAAMKEKADG